MLFIDTILPRDPWGFAHELSSLPFYVRSIHQIDMRNGKIRTGLKTLAKL